MTEQPILVTGAAGFTGGVGRSVVAMLRRRGLPVRDWFDAKMNGPMRCEPPARRSWSRISRTPLM